jgi:hypothetical protein
MMKPPANDGLYLSGPALSIRNGASLIRDLKLMWPAATGIRSGTEAAMRHWSGMLIQSGGSKPFVVSLMEILADEFPYIIFKMGGFVDRDIRGKPGVKSMHASGRAIDIYLIVRERQQKALGKLLYGMFKDNAAVANTGHVIYDGLAWSPGNAADRSTHDAGIRDLHDDQVIQIP